MDYNFGSGIMNRISKDVAEGLIPVIMSMMVMILVITMAMVMVVCFAFVVVMVRHHAMDER